MFRKLYMCLNSYPVQVPLWAMNISGALHGVLVFREHSYPKSSAPEKATLHPPNPAIPPFPAAAPTLLRLSVKAVTSRLDCTDLVSDFVDPRALKGRGEGAGRCGSPLGSPVCAGVCICSGELRIGLSSCSRVSTSTRGPPAGRRRQRVCRLVGGGQTSCPALELLPAGAGRRRVWTEFGTD